MTKRHLTTRNYKLLKGEGRGFYTAGLSLAPSTESIPFGGRDLCPKAGACKAACLVGSGRNRTGQAESARVRRTLAYLKTPNKFFSEVFAEIDSARRYAAKRGLTLAIRPNVLSDQPLLAKRISRQYPEVSVYDYTKIPKPWLRVRANYHLTFSLDESNHADAVEAMRHGVNVAVVFNVRKGRDLPSTYTLPGDDHPYPVIDGDENDLRFLDPQGVIVGLRTKGSNAAMAEGISAGFIKEVTT